ncbi:MAG: hypothetical protein NWE92_04760 [Candidatus Bathyarchaeota archaeon]|nr:hypothetical protein [Candidatus Bathyarchaeota archaeon]
MNLRKRLFLYASPLVLSLLLMLQVVAEANPMIFPTHTAPPDNAVLSVKLLSPKENATYTNGTINVCFTKEINSLPGISTSVHLISSYQGDWMNSSKWCPFPPGADAGHWNSFQVLQHNFTLTQIPVGWHTLKIDSQGQGSYYLNETEYVFDLQKKIVISFFIDSSPVNRSQTVNQIPNATPIVPEVSASTTSTSSQSKPTLNTGSIAPSSINSLLIAVIAILVIAVMTILLYVFRRRETLTSKEFSLTSE